MMEDPMTTEEVDQKFDSIVENNSDTPERCTWPHPLTGPRCDRQAVWEALAICCGAREFFCDRHKGQELRDQHFARAKTTEWLRDHPHEPNPAKCAYCGTPGIVEIDWERL